MLLVSAFDRRSAPPEPSVADGRHPAGQPPPQITAGDLATGACPELSRFSVGRRAIIFARRPEGWGIAMVTVALNADGYVERVQGAFYLGFDQVEGFQRAVAEAVAQIEGASW